MSILLDDREDSALADHLARFGLPVSIVRLDYADLVIESSYGWLIGYERKRLTDLINSMRDRRLSGKQLRGMRALYDRTELIIEGYWRAGDGGTIETPRGGSWQPYYHRGKTGAAGGSGGISYRQVDSYLYSQSEIGGVAVWRTGGTVETAHLVASRWHWWQKDYELHKSVDALHTNDPSKQKRGAVTVQHGDANPVTLVAAQVPGIDAKAWDVGRQFSTPQDMCNATERDWREIEWTDRRGNVKHFGKESAAQIVDWLQRKQ